MTELVPGGNVPLPGGILTLRVPGPFDVCALITDDGGKVRGDGDFVFYNQPTTSGARLQGQELVIDPRGLRAGASRVTVVISSADPATPLARLPAPTLHITGPGSRALARFTPSRPQRETVLLLAEIYRRGGAWKLRALGQGYADGLAGVARDFGVDVAEDTAMPGSAPHRGGSTGRVHTAPHGRGPSGRMPSAPQAHGPTSRITPTPQPHGSTGRATPTPRAGGQTGRAIPSPRPHGPTGQVASVPGPDGFLGLVNSARARAGSPPVSLDARLTAAARAHAGVMAARGVLGSEGPDGTSVYQRVTAAGYAYLTIGEHLVSGPRTPDDFVEYCLSSEQTRRTLCEPGFDQAGLACVADRSGGLYWTALWARPFSPGALARTASEVVALTNAERAAAGLPPLSADPSLTNAAQAHSDDMVARAFYSHTSPGGAQPWDRAAAAGSTRRTIGENIACGQRSPAEVVLGWMNSPGHRANILKLAFTHIGIGLAGGGKSGTYWTQLFGA
ncbi:CAP domain-containing protein [Streptomyces sp. NPDC050535]|uniref:CAP domain-containing protein n=1 Tax=Streptomyces sp. NPDC050535 TaxID=3365626 RepID=UPI00378BA162